MPTLKPYDLLILDYGGVYSFEYTAENYEKIMKTVFGRVPTQDEQVEISALSHKLGTNTIKSDGYVMGVSEILELQRIPSTELFEATTISVTNQPSPEMSELVKKVHEMGIKVSLLSDMYMFEVLKTRAMGRYEGFDYVSLSAEVGITKKDPAVFNATLNHFEVTADRALFVDDTFSNVNVAQEAGITSLWADKQVFKSAKQLSDKILEMLT